MPTSRVASIWQAGAGQLWQVSRAESAIPSPEMTLPDSSLPRVAGLRQDLGCGERTGAWILGSSWPLAGPVERKGARLGADLPMLDSALTVLGCSVWGGSRELW